MSAADDELPDALADAAGAALLGADASTRPGILRGLVAAHPEHERALHRFAHELAGAERAVASLAESAPLPAEIAGHRVLRQLGEGAFGTVFLCAQRQPVEREVAIKVLRPGVGDAQTLRRFAVERQLLAQLGHPAITRIFDAGELADGRPFFVMEHVDGLPITSHCESRGLPCAARVRLFVELCRGVEHAHNKGIVHRDLKPANVLVVETESGPLPKIIDFGMAKVLRAATPTGRGLTDAGRVMGTPGYMSPEQAAGQVDGIDERSDVYALGVMLFEVLTGELPFPPGGATTGSEAPRPSACATKHLARTAGVSPPSGSRPRASDLRGDLDWIVLRALAGERERRYADAGELADDLERHLRGEAITAGPPSASYRLRKLARRHRAALTATFVASLVIAIGVHQARSHGEHADAVAATARAEADRNFEIATQAVEQLLTRADDDRLRDAPAGDASRQALLQDALAFYDRFLRAKPGDPGLRAGRCRTLQTLSQVYWLLGLFEPSAATASEARDEATVLLALAPESPANRARLAGAQRRLGKALASVGKHQAAVAELGSAVAHLEACSLVAPHEHVIAFSGALRELGASLAVTDRPDECLVAFRRAEQVLAEQAARQPDDAAVRNELVSARVLVSERLLALQKRKEASEVLQRASEELESVTVDRPRVTAQIHAQLGEIAFYERDFDGAVEHLRKGTAAAAQWRTEHPLRLAPYQLAIRLERGLASAANVQEDWEGASAAFRRAIELEENVIRLFPQDPLQRVRLASLLHDFARCLWDRFRIVDLEEAEACARRAVAVQDEVPDSVDANARLPRWMLLSLVAHVVDSRGKADSSASWREIAPLIASAPAGVRVGGWVVEDRLIEANLGVARSLLAAGDREQARRALERAQALFASAKPDHNKLAIEWGRVRSRLAVAEGDAAGCAAAAERILAARDTWLAHHRAGDCLFAAWRCAERSPAVAPAIATGYRDRAAKLYQDVLDSLRKDVVKHPTDAWFVVPWGEAGVRMAILEVSRGNPARASVLLEAALPALERVMATTLADLWDAELFAEGQALQRELRAKPPR